MRKKVLSLLLVLFLVCFTMPVVSAQESEAVMESLVSRRSVHSFEYTMVLTREVLPDSMYIVKRYAELPDGTIVRAQGTVFLQSVAYGFPEPGVNYGTYKGILTAYMPYAY